MSFASAVGMTEPKKDQQADEANADQANEEKQVAPTVSEQAEGSQDGDVVGGGAKGAGIGGLIGGAGGAAIGGIGGLIGGALGEGKKRRGKGW